jgi:hypothetical protein
VLSAKWFYSGLSTQDSGLLSSSLFVTSFSIDEDVGEFIVVAFDAVRGSEVVCKDESP